MKIDGRKVYDQNAGMIEIAVDVLKEEFPDISESTIKNHTFKVMAEDLDHFASRIFSRDDLANHTNQIFLALGSLLATSRVIEQARIAIKQTQKQEQ